MVQGPPRPPGLPGQDGKDSWDGQMPQMPRGIINVPGVAPAPLDMTSLENSFENLGRTMVDVLTIQQQTNLTLQDQVRRANDAQMEETMTMHDLADMTEQRTYDSMFVAVPIYHGNDDKDFDEWADQLEVSILMIRVKLTLQMLQMLLHTNPNHQDEPFQSMKKKPQKENMKSLAWISKQNMKRWIPKKKKKKTK